MVHAQNVFGRQRRHRALQIAGIDQVMRIGSKYSHGERCARPPPRVTPAQRPTFASPASGEGASQYQKQSPGDKAMSIYQDITFDGSRYVREKKVCLFNKT